MDYRCHRTITSWLSDSFSFILSLWATSFFQPLHLHRTFIQWHFSIPLPLLSVASLFHLPSPSSCTIHSCRCRHRACPTVASHHRYCQASLSTTTTFNPRLQSSPRMSTVSQPWLPTPTHPHTMDSNRIKGLVLVHHRSVHILYFSILFLFMMVGIAGGTRSSDGFLLSSSIPSIVSSAFIVIYFPFPQIRMASHFDLPLGFVPFLWLIYCTICSECARPQTT